MEKKNVTLSIAITTFNEEQNVASCLSSVAGWVDEIVVVDGGSSDSTVDIAKSFNAKVISTDNPRIFHINKQKALDACHSKWILQLDADEVVPESLKEEIQSIVRDGTKEVGFYIPRKNYFWGHWMRKGGQYPDYVIRFFLRGKGTFPQKSVHEQIEIEGSIGHLKHPLLHYSYKNLSDYWDKADTYTTLAAQDLRANRLPINVFMWVDYFLIKPLFTFFSLFVRHKGFVDGFFGFVFAVFSSLHHPWTFIKYKRLLLFLLLLLSLAAPIRAEYVLPYPSYMPGNKLYKISRLADSAKQYWYWGNIGRLKYHMSLSDKYLVEAKTLFDYKQFALAVDALDRSNKEFLLIGSPPSPYLSLVKSQANTHIQFLESLQKQVPYGYSWREENKEAHLLSLHSLLGQAIDVRSWIFQ